MKVLVTVNATWNIWNFRKPLISHLLAEGHQVVVFAPRDDSVSRLEDLGCTFRNLDMSAKGLNPIQGLQIMRQMLAAFEAEQPDVVLSYTIKNNIFGAFAAKRRGVHFLPNVSGLGTAFLSGSILEKTAVQLYRSAFRGLPDVFFQNHEDSALFVEKGMVTKKQVRLLPGSGIDLEYFAKAPYPDNETPLVFLMIARLLRDKGVLEYVDAARQIRKRHPHASFQLLGPAGSENRTAISAQDVRGWVAEGCIEYIGETDDVRPYIAKSHCLVLPSYREGAPRTLIEGAAMGRPLITTDVPGCRQVVENNVNGFHCAPRCSESLAEAIERFIELPPQERAAMGAAGRLKMEREYCHTIVSQIYSETIEQLPGCQSVAA